MRDDAPADDCFACSLTAGVLPLVGGELHRTAHWVVEHAVGPLELGTMVVKPLRHVCHVADLDAAETMELGPLLQEASAVATELCRPDQVYVCLWSHSGLRPGHIHFVVEPVQRSSVVELAAGGPTYQSHRFREGVEPTPTEVEAFCEAARPLFRRVVAGGAAS
ncbi:hypothetical protein [Dermatobacter hominis]|uniref:hypothetical protein n=1 Tax=Dermatobacter hominis TaxID=2884263 RepID=UPI001D12D583|nr:hypothetical protein [Dermatobacter hominis]UDY34496.1 hypothetical protein LH044_14260 [Dermatobacter hominis]